MAKFDVDSDLVHKLAALLKETGLGEIEYEAEGRRVRVALPASPGLAVLTLPAATTASDDPIDCRRQESLSREGNHARSWLRLASIGWPPGKQDIHTGSGRSLCEDPHPAVEGRDQGDFSSASAPITLLSA